MKLKTLMAVSLAMAISLPVYASGIPTVDVASITQLVVNAQQQAKEALAQLDKAKEAISQAKSQYDHYKSIMQGNDKLGDFLNDPLLNELLPVSDWQDIYSQAKDLPNLRTRYGLTSSDPKIQAAFDKLLSQADTLEKQYDASNKRIKTAEGLRSRLNSVETPKDREQLGLRYQQEMLELQNQQAQLQNTRYLMEQQNKIDDAKRAQAFEDYMLGKSKQRPSY
ncbi:TPA: P-type DNA transfer protein VirB5 [Klebsiella pneumoniae]|jgi:type IV secretion system protein VirB5|uniref:P-type DNA transfer protein VirB5 n=1 Tax=Enterobacteriaceae TaxID=543 RepID=UPI0005EE81B2|nr:MULTISPECIES: P-type DNA transfer protein VirB5 [Enterobacteriaceae]EAO2851321.1 P-type DNA transfer protein VirB5 [Salmonella enterica]EEH8383335.1 P-type DNA transfer protein VirB5 [Salmonella enterica subsp. enterica serovar Montevideo]EHB7391031.1 P-type DNA transfer protein VirB5 [Shigella flexneri]APV28427.1 conjugal transfer protein [Klebsiella pneumoniae]AXZ56630.1 P-type DNA transfer protein VirB5 [Klebsiella pneumoniae]